MSSVVAHSNVPLPGRSPIRRIAIAGLLLVAVLLVGMAMSLVSSRHAERANTAALGSEQQLSLAAQERDALYDRASVFEATKPLTPSALALLRDAEMRFGRAAAQQAKDPEFHQRLAALRVADAGLVTSEQGLARVIGQPGEAAGLSLLHRRQAALDDELNVYTDASRSDAASDARAAAATDHEMNSFILGVDVSMAILWVVLLAFGIRLLTSWSNRMADDAQRLEGQIAELHGARLETLQRLALAAEYRDHDTLCHTERVGQLAALAAERLGLPSEQIELLELAAPLHDVGKLGVPDGILCKPGALTGSEWEQMKEHSMIGARILEGSNAPVLQLSEEIARSHHERWDGTGYPDGLAGEKIPISARIVAVADVFDALTHDRPYKDAWRMEDALSEISQQTARHFDPRVVAAFLTLDHTTLRAFTADPMPSIVEPRERREPQLVHSALLLAG